MSLFKAREWWATVSGYEEFHDLGCLAVGNLDNSSTGAEKIVVGSFQGLVRIYEPRPPKFSPDHVILEQQFASPVLQVAIGVFVQGSPALHLAVLHPRELSVCTLTSELTSEGGRVNTLKRVYKHPLQHTACNMTWGHFGGDKKKESVCVQSMDGQLSFFSQLHATFSCFLPDFLLPGPLAYVPAADALLTVNSAHILQVFWYQSLQNAGSVGVATRDTGKRFQTKWTANLGEGVVDIAVLSPSSDTSQILVLGERSLFSFTDEGVLRFMKKLDFNPSCIHGYCTQPPTKEEDSGRVQYLVATHTGQLLVYRDTSLLWVASLDHPPVQLATGAFRELEGVIVTLDELGHLTCSYLGTDPTSFAVNNQALSRVKFEDVDKELSILNKLIRKTQKEGPVTDKALATLLIESQVDDDSVRVIRLGDDEVGVVEEAGPDQLIKKCVEVKLTVRSSSSPALRDVCVSVETTLPLTTHPSHFTLSEVTAHSPQHLVLTVVATPTLLPTSTCLTLSATYTSTEDSPQVLKQEVELPLHLFCEPGLPDKDVAHKVVVEVNHCERDLSQLFPPPLVHPSSPNNAFGLIFLNSTKLTIVASPATPRYRVQSDSMAAVGVGLEILLSMLNRHFSGKSLSFKAVFTPPLPLSEYFEIVDRHYQLRMNIEHCRDWLNRHAQQFRAIQKRLLTRFKDKTPVGLAHLDTLLDGTHMQLIALAEKNELFQLELQECSNQLSCATTLINTLLRLATSMSHDDYQVLSAALSPHITMETDQGWEECTDAAVTHLLRTTLSKSSKEAAATPSPVEMPQNSSKLKKHIALLCERVLKGWMPVAGKVEATQSLKPSEQVLSDQTRSQSVSESKLTRGKSKPSLSRLPALPEDGESQSEQPPSAQGTV